MLELNSTTLCHKIFFLWSFFKKVINLAKIEKKVKKQRFKWFLNTLHQIFDVAMFILCIMAVIMLYQIHNNQNLNKNKPYVTLSQPKHSKRKVKLPKSQIMYSPVYCLTPKKQVKKYRIVNSIYGSYHKKLKHPKVTYLANFYSDPNYASKEKPINEKIYILLNGIVMPKFKAQSESQVNLTNSNYCFDSKKHYILWDTKPYLHVMQLKNYNLYGNKPMPNTTNASIIYHSNKGPMRYLKLNEFKLTRLKKTNVSILAQNGQLFCGISK